MSSSNEAFRKFEIWKKSRTVLKLTVVTKGEKPEISRGFIVAIDEDCGLVQFVPKGKRSFPRIDFTGASFVVGKRVVESTRGEDSLMFVED